MVKIINNLWSPVPWGWGCGGHHTYGGNNWLDNVLKYQVVFSMMDRMTNLFRCYATPPQQQAYSPYYGMGLQLGGGNVQQQLSYEEYLEQQQNTKDFAELKNAYSEFKFTNIGGEYQATLKSDKTQRFSGSTPLELMDEMNAYIDANPDAFKAKPAKKTDTAEAAEAAEAAEVAEAERADGADGVDDADDGKGVDDDGDDEIAVQVPQGWNKTFRTHVRTELGNTPSVDQVIEKMYNFCGMTTQGMSDENKQKLKDDLIKYNPSCFIGGDKNSPDYGKCNTEKFSWDKLDLPNGDVLKGTYGAKEYVAPTPPSATTQTKIATYRYKDSGGEDHQRLDYNGGNRVYKKNGTSSLDDDAVFVINGQEYTIRKDYDNKKLDFYEITEMRSLGTDFKLIDHETGHFNLEESFWKCGQKYRGFKFEGSGPLGGCLITWDTTLKKVVLQKDGQNYVMDDIMVGNIKL